MDTTNSYAAGSPMFHKCLKIRFPDNVAAARPP
jgi:hypothetical protein